MKYKAIRKEEEWNELSDIIVSRREGRRGEWVVTIIISSTVVVFNKQMLLLFMVFTNKKNNEFIIYLFIIIMKLLGSGCIQSKARNSSENVSHQR